MAFRFELDAACKDEAGFAFKGSAMKPLITALVDTYNHERYIEQAIESVLEQGLSAEELEVVVVDDGSTDRTPEILQKFAPRVRHVRKKNGGQASAFNAAFPETSGEIVAFLDGDDWWAEGKLRKVIEALEGNPEIAGVGHGYYEFREGGGETLVRLPSARTVLNIENREAINAALTEWPFLVTSGLTVRRNVLEWIMPLAEDMVFMADTAIQAGAVVRKTLVLPEPLFYYRQHGKNLYSIDLQNRAKLRRRYEMTELVYGRIEEMLLRLGVEREKVAMLLDPNWVEVRRQSLRTFGGSPLKTFRTEMRAFAAERTNAGAGYRLFKYAVTGGATLLLSPRVFYRLRDWYARENLGRLRERVVKAGSSGALRG